MTLTKPMTHANVKLIFSKCVSKGLYRHSNKVAAIKGEKVKMKNRKVPE